MALPPLREEAGPAGPRMTMRQRPGAPWAFVLFFLCMAPMALGPVLGFPVFIAAFFGVFASLFLKTEVSVELTPTRLRLRGWTGRLPRPRQHDLALHELTVETRSNWKINNVPHLTLVLRPAGGEPVIVPVLAVRQHDLDRITTAVDTLRVEARERHGAGADEIPDELRGLLARGRTPEER